MWVDVVSYQRARPSTDTPLERPQTAAGVVLAAGWSGSSTTARGRRSGGALMRIKVEHSVYPEAAIQVPTEVSGP